MAEFVRVRLENGVEKSVPAATAKRAGFAVLDEPALDGRGRMLPTRRGVGMTRADVQASTDDAPAFLDLKVAELKAEIDRRNEGREEADLIPSDGKKADLIAALEADGKR